MVGKKVVGRKVVGGKVSVGEKVVVGDGVWGVAVGPCVGFGVGTAVGLKVGLRVGAGVGFRVGLEEGAAETEGLALGESVVGVAVGGVVGATGAAVTLPPFLSLLEFLLDLPPLVFLVGAATGGATGEGPPPDLFFLSDLGRNTRWGLTKL